MSFAGLLFSQATLGYEAYLTNRN